MPKVYFLPQSEKEFDRLPKKAKTKVEKIITQIGKNPLLGKKLGGKLKGLYSARAWPYRIIYKVERSTIIIIRILHRQRAYK